MNLDHEQSLRFHYLAGTYLTGCNYVEFLEEFVEMIPTHNKNNEPIKGNKSLKAFTHEALIKTQKHMAMLKQYININKDSMAITEAEIEKLSSTISIMLTLSPQGQQRVRGLIEKIKKDASEIEFWKEFESQQ